MRQRVEELTNILSAYVDTELAVLLETARDAQRVSAWQVAALVPGTIILVLIFTFLVARPISQIDSAIHQLGKSGFSKPIRIKGPTDLERLGRQLDWLRLRLLDLAQEKNKFLRHMSHELKTPLANIREGTELLLDGSVGELEEQQREVADILRMNGLKLQQLIENLLSFSAWQTKSEVLNLSDFPLRVQVISVAKAQRLALKAANIQLKLEVDDIIVNADQDKIRTVLDNLLSNAVKFTPKGGQITIRAAPACLKKKVRVSSRHSSRVVANRVARWAEPALACPSSSSVSRHTMDRWSSLIRMNFPARISGFIFRRNEMYRNRSWQQMDNNNATNWLARLATIVVVVSAMSGCAAASKATGWLKGERTADARDPVILGAPEADAYLKELSSLAVGDPATQAEIYADAAAAAQLTPGPNTELRLALVLATPGHTESDPERAQSMLREVLTQDQLLTPAELSLAKIHLNNVERLIVANNEARRLRESSSRAARTEEQALSQRLSSVEAENRRLRGELEEAEQKLEAITTIERSIREQE
jgi:hypothetical protein